MSRFFVVGCFVVVASCCGTIRDEEFAAMAERECPDLIAAADSAESLELSEADKKLIAWCREVSK